MRHVPNDRLQLRFLQVLYIFFLNTAHIPTIIQFSQNSARRVLIHLFHGLRNRNPQLCSAVYHSSHINSVLHATSWPELLEY